MRKLAPVFFSSVILLGSASALAVGDMTKSKKASSRVTSANQETAAAAGAASRSTKRKAIGGAAVEKVAKRQFEKTASRAIQAHTRASGQRQQARRDSR